MARTKSPAPPELQEALQRLGARRVEATIVASLLETGPMQTSQLVERTGLRQPEVSVGMKELRDRGWIDSEPVPRPGKGRPMHLHRLSADPASIRKHYEAQGEATLKAFTQALHLVKKKLGPL